MVQRETRTFSKGMITIIVFTVGLSFLVTGCNSNHTNDKTVSVDFFSTMMVRDYQQLQKLVDKDSMPDSQAWEGGRFIVDNTLDNAIEALWIKGPIRGYTISQISLENDNRTGSLFLQKIAYINFRLLERDFVAKFVIRYKNPEWYIVSNPTPTGDVLIWFEELE